MINHKPLYPPKTPLMFSDGTKIYKKFAKEYITHKKGLFILAPSGTGKTYYIKNQTKNHWIDGDALWECTGAHPQGAWWKEGDPVIDIIDQRSDVITTEAKKLGFWIMGASNNWLKPDAIVIPDWKIHKKYIKLREQTNYDGGATSEDHAQVLGHRKFILQWAKKGVPKFKTIEEAVNYLTK